MLYLLCGSNWASSKEYHDYAYQTFYGVQEDRKGCLLLIGYVFDPVRALQGSEVSGVMFSEATWAVKSI